MATYQPPVRHVPIAIRRAAWKIGARLRSTFADTPYLFFAVVVGVAVVFRIGIGFLRSAPLEPEVPVFASTEAAPPPSAKSDIAPANDAPPASGPVSGASTGKPGAPAPARTPPRPRGHGRRAPHGG